MTRAVVPGGRRHQMPQPSRRPLPARTRAVVLPAVPADATPCAARL